MNQGDDPAVQVFRERVTACDETLLRTINERLETVRELYVRGVEIDWTAFDHDYPRNRVALPTTVFERRRHWADDAERVRRTHSGLGRLEP